MRGILQNTWCRHLPSTSTPRTYPPTLSRQRGKYTRRWRGGVVVVERRGRNLPRSSKRLLPDTQRSSTSAIVNCQNIDVYGTWPSNPPVWIVFKFMQPPLPGRELPNCQPVPLTKVETKTLISNMSSIDWKTLIAACTDNAAANKNTLVFTEA